MLFSHRKEWSTGVHDKVDEPWIHNAKWKEPDSKADILSDSIHMKFPEWVNPWKQEEDEWCPGAGGKEGLQGDCLVTAWQV